MAILYDIGIFSVNDTDGSVGAGWKLNFYDTGTSTRRATYPTSSDADATTNANANPVVADAAGRFPAIWLIDANYKAILTDANDVVKVTRDPATDSGGGGGSPTTFATTAEARAGTVTNEAIDPATLFAAQAPQTLTDDTTVAWNMALGFNAKVTIAGNRTLTVSNPKEGASYSLDVKQDATGSRTMTWPASFDWGTTGAPTLTTTASKRDRITLFCTDAATPAFDAFLSGKGFT